MKARWLIALILLPALVGCSSPRRVATPSTASPSTTAPTEATTSSSSTVFVGARGCPKANPSKIVVINLNPDTPMPECVRVSPDQQLEVVNSTNAFNQTGETVTVTFGGFARRLAPGQGTTFTEAFGRYLSTGAHYLYAPPLPRAYDALIWLDTT